VTNLGKLLIIFGGVLAIIGVVVMVAGRANLPFGRLPGDIVYRGKNSTFYFPLVTCIVLSLVFSLIMWLIGKFSR
jgi:hypothetical protein